MATYHEILTANATTYINVGNINSHHGILIKYACSRGTDDRAGQISILNDGIPSDDGGDWFSDEMGLTLGSDINGNDIRLVCAVDNSSANDITFNYNRIRINL